MRFAPRGATAFVRKPIGAPVIASLWQFCFEKNPALFAHQEEKYRELYTAAQASRPDPTAATGANHMGHGTGAHLDAQVIKASTDERGGCKQQ